jgi:large subunit ribosomal protein L17
MRHRKSGRQFSRNTSHRRAMLRALTANLIAHERIETTDAKAKELRRVAERVITKARRLGEIAYTPADKLSLADRARRHAAQKQVGKFLQRFAVVTKGVDESEKIDLIEKVFVDLAKRYKARAGGYTRIIKVGNRRGDNAPISIIELVRDGEPTSGATDEPAPAAPKAAAAVKAAPVAEAVTAEAGAKAAPEAKPAAEKPAKKAAKAEKAD